MVAWDDGVGVALVWPRALASLGSLYFCRDTLALTSRLILHSRCCVTPRALSPVGQPYGTIPEFKLLSSSGQVLTNNYFIHTSHCNSLRWGRILNFGIGQLWSLVRMSTALNTFIWCKKLDKKSGFTVISRQWTEHRPD